MSSFACFFFEMMAILVIVLLLLFFSMGVDGGLRRSLLFKIVIVSDGGSPSKSSVIDIEGTIKGSAIDIIRQ